MLLLFLVAILPGLASAQQNPPPDLKKRSEDVVKRGEHVMGFSHEATIHHFGLFKNGGEIAVTAKQPNDKASIDQIRTHLGHIARMFSSGNFTAPISSVDAQGRTLHHAPSCDTRRMGEHKLAQVSGFRDQETEIGNSKIDT